MLVRVACTIIVVLCSALLKTLVIQSDRNIKERKAFRHRNPVIFCLCFSIFVTRLLQLSLCLVRMFITISDCASCRPYNVRKPWDHRSWWTRILKNLQSINRHIGIFLVIIETIELGDIFAGTRTSFCKQRLSWESSSIPYTEMSASSNLFDRHSWPSGFTSQSVISTLL